MIKRFFYLGFFFLLTFSCNFSNIFKTGKPLVKVNNEYLYFNDINHSISENLTSEDSLIYINKIINNWIENRLLLNQAKKVLKAEENDIEKKVNDYRNSLLIHMYKQKLIQEELNSTVSEEQCREYYEKYADNFITNSTLVRATFLKLPVLGFRPYKVRRLLADLPDNQSIKELNELGRKDLNNFKPYFYKWEIYDNFEKKFPQFAKYKNYILKKKYFIIREKNDYYIIQIHDIIKSGNLIPLEVKMDEIKHIILHNRKISIVKKLEKKLYDEAKKNNTIKIYQ